MAAPKKRREAASLPFRHPLYERLLQATQLSEGQSVMVWGRSPHAIGFSEEVNSRLGIETRFPRQVGKSDCIVGFNCCGPASLGQTLSTARERLKAGGRIVLIETMREGTQRELKEGLRRAGFGSISIAVYSPTRTFFQEYFLRRRNSASLVIAVGVFGGRLTPHRMSIIAGLADAVSVVIPCHNEEANIQKMVTGLLERYGNSIKEVILVNDNSTDRTPNVLSAMARSSRKVKTINRSKPRGVGHALREGVHLAKGKYILTVDCDMHTNLASLEPIFQTAVGEDVDLVVGSRFRPESFIAGYPRRKYLMNRLFHKIACRVLGVKAHDVSNNVKLMTKETANSLLFRSNRFPINAELGFEALVRGLRVAEIPFPWTGRDAEMGSSSFRLEKEAMGYLSSLFYLRRLKSTLSSEAQRDRSVGQKGSPRRR